MTQRLDSVATGTRVRSATLVIGQLGLGGAERQLVLLAEGLHRAGVRTEVITLFETGPNAERLTAAGVPLTNLGNGRVGKDPIGLARAFRSWAYLMWHLRRTRPQIVHAYLSHACLLATPAARLAGVPVLVAGRRSLGDLDEGRPLRRFSQRLITRSADLLIANSEAVARYASAREGLPAAKMAVVRNGLPQEAFAACEPAEVPDPQGPVLVCVANLHTYKGHRFLLDALALVRNSGRPTTLVVIGEGPQRDALARQSQRLDLDVRLLGRRTDVGRYLARADLVVHPSLTEGMPNAVMEAMAVGRPIVAADAGGTSELLHPDRGVLVPPGDEHALADAIGRLLGDPAERARLGAAARAYAAAELSADAMVARHLDIYSELVSACAE
jgi:glycosyltransferase involved in cell wall biosynthesis